MASTYSNSLRIELIANGEQSGTWGTTTNTNLGTLIEQAIAGMASVSVTTASQALTINNGASDQARQAIISLSTTTGANFAVYVPPVTKEYTFINTSAYVATVYASTVAGNTTAAGTGVAIPAGKRLVVYCDATNVTAAVDHLPSLTLATPLAVTSGGTGQTTLSAFLSSLDAAPVDSPTFTGTPSAPTASFGNDSTQLATTAFVQDAVAAAGSAAAPTGAVLMWTTASAPTGYLLCNGAGVSRATYATLFALIGTTYGSGDGSTTFNLPDFRDRFPVGAGSTYAANASGGSKDAITVSHTHTASATLDAHTHTVASTGAVTAALTADNYMSAFNLSQYSGGTGGGTATAATLGKTSSASGGGTVTINSSGSSGTNANLPPYRGIYFIIKT